jgi:peptidoglycan/LPS O-acetylase OafA/YrhL
MPGDRYRREIDGLRAIAIGAVLLFHADVPGFDGGYLGVDIFFVISGYLITRIIVRSVDAGDFSFGAFYLRRLRRLGPALIAMLAATLLVGALLLTPEHMRNLGASAAFSAISAANFYFWFQSGYFDASAVHKPLLHAWSLGVEEQFYLVWPALILIITKAARRFLWPAIFVLGLISLTAAEARSGAHQAETFFHFP